MAALDFFVFHFFVELTLFKLVPPTGCAFSCDIVGNIVEDRASDGANRVLAFNVLDLFGLGLATRPYATPDKESSELTEVGVRVPDLVWLSKLAVREDTELEVGAGW